MCNSEHWHEHAGFGFLVDTPEIRALVDATQEHTGRIAAFPSSSLGNPPLETRDDPP
jgi:hypothetical protein